jgi:hypothetical protein
MKNIVIKTFNDLGMIFAGDYEFTQKGGVVDISLCLINPITNVCRSLSM